MGSKAELVPLGGVPDPICSPDAESTNDDDADEAFEMCRRCDGRGGSVGDGTEGAGSRSGRLLGPGAVADSSAGDTRSTPFPFPPGDDSSPRIEDELLSTRLKVLLDMSAALLAFWP